MKKQGFLAIFVVMLVALSTGLFGGDFPYYESLEVIYLSQVPDPAEPSQQVTLRFKVTNIGPVQAEDVVFEILPEFPFSLYSGEAVVAIGSLHGKQIGDTGYILKYKLRVDKNAAEGEHEIKLRYKFADKEWITLDPFTLNVQTHDAILSVVSVTTNPELITPGENVKLSIRIKNVADSLLEYITIKLTLLREDRTAASVSYTEFPFSPVGSTNEKTIKRLDTNREVQIDFNLITDPDAESKVYKIPITITYNDDTDRNYSKDNIITMVVAEKPDLSVFVDSSTVRQAGKTGDVLIKFVNKGLTDIKFLNVKLKKNHNYELLSSEEVYVGNIDSDDYETAEFTVFVKPDASGEMDFPIHITYKDDNNRAYSKDFDLNVKLYSKKEALSLGLDEKSNTVGIIIVLLIVGGGIFAYRRYVKKKKKS